MQSKIRIEFDFDINQPVLRITLAKDSDDLRDTMLKSFIQKATLGDSMLYFQYPGNNTDNSVLDLRCELNHHKK